mmetsp:Transcript_42480/g.99728  ORF Transcript_42480/g.99728 Transcript_42480/m.99728 type:complete len:359 (-) Transcript_42480:82-1158(-)
MTLGSQSWFILQAVAKRAMPSRGGKSRSRSSGTWGRGSRRREERRDEIWAFWRWEGNISRMSSGVGSEWAWSPSQPPPSSSPSTTLPSSPSSSLSSSLLSSPPSSLSSSLPSSPPWRRPARTAHASISARLRSRNSLLSASSPASRRRRGFLTRTPMALSSNAPTIRPQKVASKIFSLQIRPPPSRESSSSSALHSSAALSSHRRRSVTCRPSASFASPAARRGAAATSHQSVDMKSSRYGAVAVAMRTSRSSAPSRPASHRTRRTTEAATSLTARKISLVRSTWILKRRSGWRSSASTPSAEPGMDPVHSRQWPFSHDARSHSDERYSLPHLREYGERTRLYFVAAYVLAFFPTLRR